MACEPMDRILATLRVRVPGATDDVLRLELFNVMDRFFRRTNVWRWQSETTLEAGLTRYDLFPPADADLVRVMWALHGDNPIAPVPGAYTGSVSRGLIDQDATGTGTTVGDPLYDPDRLSQLKPTGAFRYALFFPTYLQVTFPPDDQQTQFPLLVEMALTLGTRCLEKDCGDWTLEEWMYDRYANDWIEGVQFALFSMIAKPWTNPALAAYHGKQFVRAMSAAKVEGEKGLIFNAQNWRFPRGGFIT